MSSLNPSAATPRHVYQLVQIDLARVAASRLQQGAVRGAEFHAHLWRTAGEETIGEAAGEAVAAAHAVFDLQVLVAARLVELPVGPEDRRPVVHEAAPHLAKRRADDLHVWVSCHDLPDHSLVSARVERGEALVHALDVEAKHLLEVLLVADETVDERYQLLRHALCLGRAPELASKVQ